METTPLDPNGLPPAPTRGCPVSAGMFDLLLAAARKGGWSAVYTVFAEGETTAEPTPTGINERPARRRTLDQFLSRRPDLRALLDSAALERRDKLLTNLEDEVVAIALGPGDTATDYGKNGQVTRVRTDKRNKLTAILKLLSSHAPDTYAERRKVDVAGQLNHEHHHAAGAKSGYTISPDDVRSLEPAEQSQLMLLLQRIEDTRKETSLEQPARLSQSDGPTPRMVDAQEGDRNSDA